MRNTHLFKAGDELERNVSITIATSMLQEKGIFEDMGIGEVELDLLYDLVGEIFVWGDEFDFLIGFNTRIFCAVESYVTLVRKLNMG